MISLKKIRLLTVMPMADIYFGAKLKDSLSPIFSENESVITDVLHTSSTII